MQSAERTFIVDNTGEAFRLILIRRDQRLRSIVKRLPAWAIKAIPPDLR